MYAHSHGGSAVLAETDELIGGESYVVENSRDFATAQVPTISTTMPLTLLRPKNLFFFSFLFFSPTRLLGSCRYLLC